MKRIIALILVLMMCISMCACSNSKEDKLENIIALLEDGEYDMAISAIEDLKISEGILLRPESNGTDWHCIMRLGNSGTEAITLVRLEIIDKYNGSPTGDPFVFDQERLGDIGLNDLVLAPGENRAWDDWHPIVDHFDFREYRFVFVKADGSEVVLSFPFDLSGYDIPQGGEMPAGDWSFNIRLENSGNDALTLESLQIIDKMDDMPFGEFFFAGTDLQNIGLYGLVLLPGDSFMWGDGHPVVSEFNFREYIFTFRNEQGEAVVMSFPYDLTQMPQNGGAADYSQDEGQDLLTLRHEASFEIEVAPGVFWVPASVLGGSRYTNAQIYGMLIGSPEAKQEQIATLYEALQLYQVGNFYSSDDNERIFENGVNWEHHKPGYDAVRTNTGCCATDSNWLNFILRGDYEEVGYMATSQRDGSGHIFNYIKHDGWYYFVDLTHYRTDWIATAVESGDINDYYSSDFIAGNVHKTESVQAYVDYIQNEYSDPPGLMFLYTAENCLAIDGVPGDGGVTIIYEKKDGVTVEIVYDDPDDQLYCEFVDPPQQYPDWSAIPDYNFPA